MFGLPSPLLQPGQSAHVFLPNLSGIHQAEAVNVTAFFAKARRKNGLALESEGQASVSRWALSVCAATRTMGE